MGGMSAARGDATNPDERDGKNKPAVESYLIAANFLSVRNPWVSEGKT